MGTGIHTLQTCGGGNSCFYRLVGVGILSLQTCGSRNSLFTELCYGGWEWNSLFTDLCCGSGTGILALQSCIIGVEV